MKTDEQVVLWLGIEDDGRVWETVWDLRTDNSESSGQELRARARAVLVEQSRRGAVEFFWGSEQNEAGDSIPAHEIGRLLGDDRWWEPAAADVLTPRFRTTALGEREYRRLVSES